MRIYHILRTPMPSATFRQQSRLWLKTQILGHGRVGCRHTSTSGPAGPVTVPAPPKSRVERTPRKIRPYLYLARVDKPIGTLLLYYPCSTSLCPRPDYRNRDGKNSMVDYDGFVCAQPPNNHPSDIPEPFRNRRVRYARSGVYDQRYVGSKFG